MVVAQRQIETKHLLRGRQTRVFKGLPEVRGTSDATALRTVRDRVGAEEHVSPKVQVQAQSLYTAGGRRRTLARASVAEY
jgi:hypothetical protein